MLNTITLIDDRVARYDVEGPLTISTILDMEELVLQLAEKVTHVEPLTGFIMVFHKSCRIEIDSMNTMTATMKRLKAADALSTVCSTVIAPDLDGYGETESIAAEMHVNSGNIFATFETYDEALAWTQAQLTRLEQR